jgi:hypothetical protein
MCQLNGGLDVRIEKGQSLMIAAAVVFTLAFSGTFMLRSSHASVGENRAGQWSFEGEMTVAVLIVSPECSASEAAAVRQGWQSLVAALTDLSASEGVRFHSVGVSIDTRPEWAVAELGRFGKFDEVASGGGWYNTAALSYMVRDIAGLAMVPQVVIVRRQPSLPI